MAMLLNILCAIKGPQHARELLNECFYVFFSRANKPIRLTLHVKTF